MRLARLMAGLVLLCAAPHAQDAPVPATLGPEPARQALERALDWLVESQRPDGAWASGALEGVLELGYSIESYYAWQLASQALACLALSHAPDTPQRRAALERGVRWLDETRPVKRGSDWDVDYVWSGLFGFAAATEISSDPRFAGPEAAARLERIGRRSLAILAANQVPGGGWGYYDDPTYSRRPKWATSFATATVLPALRRGEELGWVEDPAIRVRATRFVSRCALPNGAFSYDLRMIPRVGGESIDDVKGSLSRIQVCNWALHAVGEPKITLERLREGLEAFFTHHRFLDVAFMTPIPHEAYYYNSGYFYLFGHYYAARVIELLPEEEREGWHARLRPHLLKVMRSSGASTDYLASGYSQVAGTAFSALALAAGLPHEPWNVEPVSSPHQGR